MNDWTLYDLSPIFSISVCVFKIWEISQMYHNGLMASIPWWKYSRLADFDKIKIFAFHSADKMSRWNCLMMRVIVHFCHTQSSLVRKIEKFSMTLEIAGPYVTHTQPTMQRLKFAFSQQHFLIIWMLDGDLLRVKYAWSSYESNLSPV